MASLGVCRAKVERGVVPREGAGMVLSRGRSEGVRRTLAGGVAATEDPSDDKTHVKRAQ